MAHAQRKVEQSLAIRGENVIGLPAIRYRNVTFGNSLKMTTVRLSTTRYVPSSSRLAFPIE
jgi:hypothetical protein